MKKSIILITTLLACSSLAFSQDKDPELKYLSRDIGFNTTFILPALFYPESTPFTVMYKNYTAENKALRFGVGVNLDLNNDENNGVATSYYSENSFVSLSFNFGKEIQKPVAATRWVWFYGGDIAPFYKTRDDKTFYDGEMQSTNTYTSYGVGLRPFLGIRFNINQNLYLSAETSLNLRYSYNTQLYTQMNPQTVLRDTHGDNITLRLSPASGLFLYYRF